ncbi:universal stress protein [Dyella mobilis]|uniref:Universal stress protein n=1 Tax=Dyella mobilis TaxID=1849582 RepID=A0ABS2KC05_9GAMM|nr:universal stress protein [Dyella mobilis]MBM7128702.1 universal stress protein [Dyella mobilis]GLQ99027.1 hypothetical protein GCM10007863_34470 [Dyella mobilis]
MANRLLVLYDGSADTRRAVEEALELAAEVHASLFVLAIRLEEEAVSAVEVGERLTQDLVGFAHQGTPLGVDVDASYLDAPTPDLLQQILLAHGIDRIIMGRPEGGASRTNTLLLKALHDDCSIPITVVG